MSGWRGRYGVGMSSRAEEKAARRAEREAAHAKQQAAQRRKRSLAILGGVAALIAAIVVVAVVVGQSGDDGGGDGGPSAGQKAAQLVEGIPQKGLALGDPDAPLTIEEFIDYQCPFCKQFSDNTFPTVVKKYVRTGKARVVLRTLTFLGDDSNTAARFATAAGFQNRQWQFTEAFFARQGPENSGYVTEDFLREVSADAGVDFAKAQKVARGEPVTVVINEATTRASDLRVDSTPSFAMGPTGGRLRSVEVNSLDTDAFTKVIDEQLAAAEKAKG